MMLASAGIDQRRLERLIEVGRGLVSNLDLESLLRQILEAGRELTGAEYAALGILNEQRTELERFLTLGFDDEARLRIGDPPRGRGVLGLLIENPEPLRLANVADHSSSYGFPPAHPKMTSFLGVPIMIRGKAFGNLYLTEKRGREFDDVDERSCVVLADWAAIAIDNAHLYQRLEARKDELEQAVSSLEATTAIARALGGETDLDRVLELIVRRGRALVGARWTAILLEQDGMLEIASVAGDPGEQFGDMQIPVQGSIAGQVLRTRRSERLAQFSGESALADRGLTAAARTGLFVPLVFQDRTFGVLVAADKLGDNPQFTAEDEHLMEAFAASAATAVHTAKSVATDQLRRSIEASEQERRRWARELHDETLQGLGALKVLLSAALRSQELGATNEAVASAIEQTGLQITNLRKLITELRPAALDELGLEEALEGLARRAVEISGLEIDSRIELPAGDANLSAEFENTVYRLVQEALTNVDKHARAERAEIEVVTEGPELTVCVRDDGAGFDASKTEGGFGISGMSERARLAGGTLEVTSTPGQGTRVLARLPLNYAGS